jgi:periplasmic divalent cation tolerance protein
MGGCCQVTTTLLDQSAAERIATRLVEERLAACAQVLGPVRSTYWWEGKVEQASEWSCQLKTTLTRLPVLQARIRELHPYQVPEIIAVPILQGNPDYLKWIQDAVRSER